jgi:hypothetical protein
VVAGTLQRYLCANLESDLPMEAKILPLQAMALLSKAKAFHGPNDIFARLAHPTGRRLPR